MSKLAQNVQAAVDQLGVEPEQGETMAMTREEKTAKQRKRRAAAKAEKAKPARAARAPKAAKVPREKRAKDPIAGIRSEVKLKKLQVNTGAALSVIYRGVAGLRPSLDGVDAVAADRLIAQLRARGVEG